MDKEKALTEARFYMMTRFPFFAVIMYRMLKFQWSTEIPTAGTDGRRILLNPDFFCSLPYKQRAFILVHETAHAIFRHPSRTQSLLGKHFAGKPFLPDLMNYAQDYVVNALARDSGCELPELALLDDKYTADMSVEQVYKDLLKKVKWHKPSKSGGGEGQGQSAQLPAPEDGQEQFDAHMPKEDARSDVEWKQAIAEAAQAHKSRNRGNLPGALQSMVDEFLAPKVDWREELRAELLARAKGEISTWERPNRRGMMLFDTYLPSSHDYTTGTVVVGIDTSGSVSDAELQAFMSEISGILSDAPPEELWLLSVDAKVHEAEEVSDPVELELFARTKLVGRGGTDMTEIMKWVEEKDLTPDFVVVLTDGGTPFGEEPDYPVLWIMSTEIVAPYGKSIQIDIED